MSANSKYTVHDLDLIYQAIVSHLSFKPTIEEISEWYIEITTANTVRMVVPYKLKGLKAEQLFTEVL
jgi:hypothetical protein